jgi:hypothetical protein
VVSLKRSISLALSQRCGSTFWKDNFSMALQLAGEPGIQFLIHPGSRPAPEPARPRTRFAVEVRGFCAHTEVTELSEVLEFIDGMTGRVHVIDTLTRRLVFEGTVGDVYEAIVTSSAHEEIEP